MAKRESDIRVLGITKVVHHRLYETLKNIKKCSKQLVKNEENPCSNCFQFISWLITGTYPISATT